MTLDLNQHALLWEGLAFEKIMAVLHFVLACLLLLINNSSGTPLDDYVNKPDPTYEFRDLGMTVKMDGYTVYYINMTSQTWLTCMQLAI